MRNEIKFKASYADLKRIVVKQTNVCQFHQRMINSIYFDDFQLSDFVDSEEGTVPRQKIRFRWYGNSVISFPMSGTLEVKKTFPEYRDKDLYKLTNVSFNEVLQKSQQIRSKILKPVLLVSYVREYFQTLSGQRYTLDSNIKYQKLTALARPVAFKLDPSHILEIKVNIEDDYDVLMNQFSNFRVRFSKYCEGIHSFRF